MRFQLSDFAWGELTEGIIDKEDREITLSTQELCQYLTDAEDRLQVVQKQKALSDHSDLSDITDDYGPQIPAEEIAADDEAKYIEQEERAAERMRMDDPDYNDD